MSSHSTCDTDSVESLIGQIAADFCSELERGARPEVEAYARRHPHLASILRQVLPTLEMVRSLGSASMSAARLQETEADVGGRLGDFRIIGEVGRGGMGVVYEAEQISLGRRVALKVLPFAAVLDNRQLQRFKNEARAAAQLHHTNILPVYSVGCERGVHFYAMQFVEGPTLGDVIADLKGREIGARGTRREGTKGLRDQGTERADAIQSAIAPASSSVISLPIEVALSAMSSDGSTRSPAFFRSVATLGVQAAEALERAHARGIIHRDIKPSNLLIETRDNQMHLWVTDFGLAYCQSDTGQSLTVAGDLVGTIRYMSPEQASGGPVLLDHRTDVYSLGVTLYELLTLQPAFIGRDRPELLRKIVDQDPRPPRDINTAIPTDLQTIIGKATEKEPDDRYDTAQALAEDLERFLEDKPILAKPPSLVDRVAKWARRHIAIVLSAVILLVMALMALTITTVATQRAYDSEAEQRARAEENFHRARDAVDQMLTRVAEERLADVPHMQEIRHALLEDALEFYQRFLTERATDPAVQYETARAYDRVGGVSRLLGRFHDAEPAHKQAITLLASLVREFPSQAEYRQALAQSHVDLALLLQDFGRLRESAGHAREAVSLWEGLVVEDPDDSKNWRGVAHATAHLGWSLTRVEQYEEAEKVFRRALQLHQTLGPDLPSNPDFGSGIALIYQNMGQLMSTIGRTEEGIAAYLQSARVGAIVAASNPELSDARLRLGECYRTLAETLSVAGRDEEAERAFLDSIRVTRALVSDHPANPNFHAELSWAQNELGTHLLLLGRHSEAEEAFRSVVAVRERLVDLFPTVTRFRRYLAAGWESLGNLFIETGRREDAAEAFSKELEHYNTLVRDFQPTARVLRWFVEFLTNCPDHAFRDAVRAVELAEQLVAQEPDVGARWQYLGMARVRGGDWSGAADALRRSLAIDPNPESVAWFLSAITQWQLGDPVRAHTDYDQGIERMGSSFRPPGVSMPDVLRWRAEAADLLGIEEDANREFKKETVGEQAAPGKQE